MARLVILATVAALACAILSFIVGGVPVSSAHRAELVQEQAVASGAADRCILHDLRTFHNGAVYVAVLRDVNCPEPLAQGSGYFVIFVHKITERNTIENLVFQYEPGFNGRAMSGPPFVRWLKPNVLEVAERGTIEELDKEVLRIDGIRILYSLGNVESDLTDH
jgi:hypothetical protein